MNVLERAADRVAAFMETDDEDTFAAFDPTIIIGIITAIMVLCKKDPVEKAYERIQRGGFFVRRQIAKCCDDCCSHLKHRQRKAQVDAILKAAQDATKDELRELWETS